MTPTAHYGWHQLPISGLSTQATQAESALTVTDSTPVPFSFLIRPIGVTQVIIIAKTSTYAREIAQSTKTVPDTNGVVHGDLRDF